MKNPVVFFLALLASHVSAAGTPPAPANPEIFLPGVVSLENAFEFSITFTPDLKKLFFTRRGTGEHPGNTIYQSFFESGQWLQPEVAPFSGSYMDFEPFVSLDGKTLYFGSSRPLISGEIRRLREWMIDLSAPEEKPRPMPTPFEDIFVMYVSISKSGNVYFTGKENDRQFIYVSRYKNGLYRAPVKLPGSINSSGWIAHPFVSPDEDFLIYDAKGRKDGRGDADLYISFRSNNGKWGESLNLGSLINTAKGEMCASLSPDGNLLFFSRYEENGNGDIYYMNARFIDQIRKH